MSESRESILKNTAKPVQKAHFAKKEKKGKKTYLLKSEKCFSIFFCKNKCTQNYYTCKKCLRQQSENREFSFEIKAINIFPQQIDEKKNCINKWTERK